MTQSPLKPNDRRYWFPAKRYGWGWGMPSTWQGWVVMIVWGTAVIVGTLLLAGKHPQVFAVFIVLTVAALLGVCYFKGEPPHWRWGN